MESSLLKLSIHLPPNSRHHHSHPIKRQPHHHHPLLSNPSPPLHHPTPTSFPPLFSSPPHSSSSSSLSPIPPSRRTFTALDIASLWVGLVVGVPSFYLAGSLVDLGMSWWQGVATVSFSNLLLLLPLTLAAFPGTRHGLSFPLLARSAFGPRGSLPPPSSPPSSPAAGSPSEFWAVFFPAVNANISFWATVALNIPDFSRYARSQRDQVLGQVGLPFFMAVFTFVGLAVTSSTRLIPAESSPTQSTSSPKSAPAL